MDKDFYKDGIKWECQGSGNCCVSRGEYGFVYLDKKDRSRMAKHLKVSTQKFTKQYCHKTEGYFHIKQLPADKGNCMFLKGSKCGIYEARPTQCRTWPFWPEVLNAKSWRSDIVGFCPGAGKGKTWSSEEIESQLKEQIRSENSMEKSP